MSHLSRVLCLFHDVGTGLECPTSMSDTCFRTTKGRSVNSGHAAGLTGALHFNPVVCKLGEIERLIK